MLIYNLTPNFSAVIEKMLLTNYTKDSNIV